MTVTVAAGDCVPAALLPADTCALRDSKAAEPALLKLPHPASALLRYVTA